MLLQQARSRQWQKCIGIFFENLDKNVLPNASVFNTVAGACGKHHQWQRALCLLGMMDHCNVEPNAASFTIAAQAMTRASHWTRALNALGNMKTRSVTLDGISYGAVLEACRRGKNWEASLRLLDEMKSHDIKPDGLNFGSAAATCGLTSRWQLALLLSVGGGAGSPNIGVANWTSLISSCGRDARWEVSLKILEEMTERGLRASSVTFGAVFMALRFGSCWPHALALYSNIGRQGQDVDQAYTIEVLKSCAHANQWAHCLHLYYSQLQGTLRSQDTNIDNFREGEPAHVHAARAVVESCSRAQQWQHAMRIFPDMRHVGMSFVPAKQNWQACLDYFRRAGDDVTSNDVVTAMLSCQRVSQWQRALKVFRSTPMSLHTSALVFNISLGICADNALWMNALSTLRDMRIRKVDPDNVSYNVLLAAYKAGGRAEHSYFLVESMQKTRVIPDETTFSTAISTCKQSAQWPFALALFEHSQRTNATNAYILSAVMSACSKGGKFDILSELVDDHVSAVRVPFGSDPVTFRVCFLAFERLGHWKRALQMLVLMERMRVTADPLCIASSASSCATFSHKRKASEALSSRSLFQSFHLLFQDSTDLYDAVVATERAWVSERCRNSRVGILTLRLLRSRSLHRAVRQLCLLISKGSSRRVGRDVDADEALHQLGQHLGFGTELSRDALSIFRFGVELPSECRQPDWAALLQALGHNRSPAHCVISPPEPTSRLLMARVSSDLFWGSGRPAIRMDDNMMNGALRKNDVRV